jgi:hypothetical protein
VKSEKAHINAEEMLDATEVHYRCFGEFLSLLHLLNRLNEQRRPKILYVALILLFFVLPEPVMMKIFEILNGCLTYLICELGEFFLLRGAEKIHDEAEVAFDQWMCQGGLQAESDYGSKLGVQKYYMKLRPN